MFVDEGEVSLSDSAISDCHAEYAGGAVYVENGKVILIDSKISSCYAEEVRR